MTALLSRSTAQFGLIVGLLVAIAAGFLWGGGHGRLVELVAIGAGVLVGYVAGAPLNAIAGVATAGGFVILEAGYGRLDSDHAVSGPLYAVGTAAAVVLAGYLRTASRAGGEQPDTGPDPLHGRPVPGSLEYELQRSLRHNRFFSLLVARPDDLEERARYGPYGLERIVERVASTMGEHLRVTDVARRRGEHDLWVILPETPNAGARVVGERIRLGLGLRELELGPGKLTRISVSIGVAAFPDDAVTAYELVAAAERALGSAIKLGGNRTVLHSAPPDMPRGWAIDEGDDRAR